MRPVIAASSPPHRPGRADALEETNSGPRIARFLEPSRFRHFLSTLWLPLASACGALGLSLLLIRIPVSRYDEGFVLLNAARVLDGDVPYRDFWTIYAPGQFYTTAFFFQTIGESVLSERVWDTIARALLCVAVSTVARQLGISRFVALLLAWLIALWLSAGMMWGYAVVPALALCLWAAVLLNRYLVTRRLAWLVAAGTAVGCSLLYRLDFGCYASTAASLVVLLSTRVGYGSSSQTKVPRRFAGLPELVTMLGSVAAVAIGPTFYFISRSGIHLLWDSLIYWPVFMLHDVRGLPLPPLVPWNVQLEQLPMSWYGYLLFAWLPFYGPVLAYTVWAGIIARLWRSNSTSRAYIWPHLISGTSWRVAVQSVC